MEDPEAWLRAMTAPLARAREGSPYPVARLSVEAVANAFVVLGLLPAADPAGGRRWSRALPAPAPRPRDHVGHADPEGIRLRYHGDARDGGRDEARALAGEITEDIAELSITDDTGGTYRVPAATVPGSISGQCSASGGTRWVPEGEFLVVPVGGKAGSRGGRPAVRWLDFSAGSSPAVRVEIPSPAAVPTGIAEPPWPTPAECYLDQVAPPDHDWSIGSFETGTVELDTAAIMAGVAGALLAVGALPPDSATLTGITDRVRPDWHLALSDRQRALMDPWASPGRASGPQARQLRVTVSTLWEAAWALVDIPGR